VSSRIDRDLFRRHVLLSYAGSGATGRNGGHFITLPYDHFRSRSSRPSEGKDQGVLAVELEMRTIKEIRSLIKTHGWETEVNLGENGHTRLFFTEEEEEEDLIEYTAAKNAGVPWEGIVRLTKGEMIEKYGAAYPGVSMPAGSIWPVKFVTKLFQLAVSEAQAASVTLQLHTHTPAEAVEPFSVNNSHSQTAPRWTVRTPRGTLETRFVIHASNAWAAHLLPQFTMPDQTSKPSSGADEQDLPSCGKWIAPYRGQIIATRANVAPGKLPRRAFAADWMEDYWLPEQAT
jgi:glycine/D-amino acid oxidase-like deaminating enzyme